jgi:hypothetical protein
MSVFLHRQQGILYSKAVGYLFLDDDAHLILINLLKPCKHFSTKSEPGYFSFYELKGLFENPVNEIP